MLFISWLNAGWGAEGGETPHLPSAHESTVATLTSLAWGQLQVSQILHQSAIPLTCCYIEFVLWDKNLPWKIIIQFDCNCTCLGLPQGVLQKAEQKTIKRMLTPLGFFRETRTAHCAKAMTFFFSQKNSCCGWMSENGDLRSKCEQVTNRKGYYWLSAGSKLSFLAQSHQHTWRCVPASSW